MKKILIILGLLSILPLAACGDTKTTTTLEQGASSIDFLKVEKKNSIYSITGLKEGYPKDIILPESIDGILVNTIHKEAFKDSSIESLYVPKSISTIGIGFLKGCNELKKITISSSFVFDELFLQSEYPPKLETVEFSDGSTIVVKDSFKTYGKRIKTLIIPLSVTEIQEDTFKYLTSLTSLTIPGTLSFFTYFYEKGIFGVKDIRITEGSSKIVAYSFNSTLCVNVSIPSSVQIIERYAFGNMNKLETVSFDEKSTLKSIELGAFKATKLLKSIVLPNSLTHLGADAFNGSGLEHIILSNELEKLLDGTFLGLKNLQNLIIPSSVKEVKKGSIVNCTALETLTFLGEDVNYENGCVSGLDSISEIRFKEASKASITGAFYQYQDNLVFGYSDTNS